MVAQTPLLLHLSSSFLISTLRLHVEPELDSAIRTPFILISPNRNISVSLRDRSVLADNLPVASISSPSGYFTISARCQHGFGFRLDVDEFERTIASPSFCANHGMNEILIGPDDREEEKFFGCIRNVTLGPSQILSSWCRFRNGSAETGRIDENSELALNSNTHLIRIGERIRVNEGESIRIQWKNLPFNDRRFGIAQIDIRLRILHFPRFGTLRIDGRLLTEIFLYDDLISRSVTYEHDGSETTEDSFDIESWIEGRTLPQRNTVPIDITPIDDSPSLSLGPEMIVNIPPLMRVPLTERNLQIWDMDSPTDSVWIEIRSAENVDLIGKDGNRLSAFSLAQFLNGNVFMESNGGPGEIHLGIRNQPNSDVMIRTNSAATKCQLEKNSGLRVTLRSSRLISSANLSVSTNISPIFFNILDGATFGRVECLRPLPTGAVEEFQLCSEFSNEDIENLRVRYRHTSDNRPPADSFAFQIRCGKEVSAVHEFVVDLIPISVRVVISESLLLNGSVNGTITSRHLMSTSFPDQIPKDQMLYHIVEPPKLGMLSRKMEGNRMRRIGFSSNFTQKHVDENTLVYSLHFPHHSIVSDFFVFRMVTPSIVTEEFRFDITFVPGGHSVRLFNRTLIVHEGSLQTISNKSIWLETPDGSDFVFLVSLSPQFGRLRLLDNQTLRSGDNFTSEDILHKKISYEHLGAETRMDRIYLLAVGKKSGRIPFSLDIQIIPSDDNPPQLVLSNRSIFLLENSERIFYPFLLPWMDADDSSSILEFFFPELFRSFTISRRETPEIPVRNFTNLDLLENRLIIRHVGVKNEFTQRYFVSDGKHTVQSEIRFVAVSRPFVRLAVSTIPTVRLESSSNGLLAVNTDRLSAESSNNWDPEKIQFSVVSAISPFWKLQNGKFQKANNFTQKEIGEGKLFVSAFTEPRVIQMNLKAGNLSSAAQLQIEPTVESDPLQIRVESLVILPQLSSIQIDETILKIWGEKSSECRIRITQTPKFGSLILSDSPNLSVVITGELPAISVEQIKLSSLRYVHSDGNSDLDSFGFNLTLPNGKSFGPMILNFEFREADRPVLLSTRNVSLQWGATVPINSTHLRAILPSGDDAESTIYEIVERPNIGRLILNGREMETGQRISHSELRGGQFAFSANGGDSTSRKKIETHLSIRGCFRFFHCSDIIRLLIVVEADNLQSPQLIRNEPLFLSRREAAPITSRHLYAVDTDSSPQQIRFLVWRPVGGFVAHSADRRPLSQFTQNDLNKREILFITNNADSSRFGFSFLVTDGIHQLRPEWFSVEKSGHSVVELEANVRLNISPMSEGIISSDNLRSRIPDVPSDEIIYSITRPPTHGRLIRDGDQHMVTNFTQTEIDNRRIRFRPMDSPLGIWSLRDHFNFIVGTLNSVQPTPSIDSDNDFRFRLTISYGFLRMEEIGKVISGKTLEVSRRGSVALNSTFLNLSRLAELCDDELLIEIRRPPLHGTVELFRNSNGDNSDEISEEKANILSASELHSGRHLIYRHNGEMSEDRILLGISAVRERSNSPLEIPIDIRITEADSDIQIERFRSELTIVSGASTSISSADFLSFRHSDKTNSVTYRIVQNGSNGAHFRANGSMNELSEFTQTRIDEAQIRIEHLPQSADDKFDVFVLSIGNHLRVLRVRVEPLALQLRNHSTLFIPQGKTYAVLGREYLGAESNGDREEVIYNVTKAPENGSLYWVAGEKTVSVFSQRNIDNGDILYAQLNMNAFQDSFDFVVHNEEMELLQKSALIRIQPPFIPQPVTVESNTMTQIGVAHLNATTFSGQSPRFLIIRKPTNGRMILYPDTNGTIVFFTLSHIIDGRVFFIASEVEEPLSDEIEMELRADEVQPSRFQWQINIIPMGHRMPESGSPPFPRNPKPITPKSHQTPELNYRFPVIILFVVLSSVVLFLLCHKSKSDKKDGDAIPNIGTRPLPEIDENPASGNRKRFASSNVIHRGDKLLDTTVYSSTTIEKTIAKPSEPLEKRNLSFKPTASYKPTALSKIAEMPKNPSKSTTEQRKLNDNQYWV